MAVSEDEEEGGSGREHTYSAQTKSNFDMPTPVAPILDGFLPGCHRANGPKLRIRALVLRCGAE